MLFAEFPWAFTSNLLNALIILCSLLLMFVVLIQRGKGGGLAGAFGGMGGSSAFGARQADAFVKITLWIAGIWVLLIMIHVKVAQIDGKSSRNAPSIQASDSN